MSPSPARPIFFHAPAMTKRVLWRQRGIGIGFSITADEGDRMSYVPVSTANTGHAHKLGVWLFSSEIEGNSKVYINDE